ncbi:MAG: GNAT family N-acetyltransferase [Pseudonocardiaceae bacterium]
MRQGDRDRAVALLCDGFAEDPVVCWVIPDPAERARALPALCGLQVAAALAAGRVALSADRHGVMLAHDIGSGAADENDDLASQLVAASGDYAERMRTCLRLQDEHHPVDTAHRYISFVAVSAARRGHGVGTALVAAALAEAATDELPVFLEATSTRNARLYRRLGFRFTPPTWTLPDGPRLHPAWWSEEPALGAQPCA